MKIKYPFLLVCFFFSNQIYAQKTETIKCNSVYVEAGGNALFYSINYDRILPLNSQLKLAPRVGLSYLPYDGDNTFKHFIIPIELNVLWGRQPQSKDFAEAGLGLTFYELIKGFKYGERSKPLSKYGNVTLLRAGFRHQKSTGGLMYRAGLLIPIMQDEFSKQKVGDDIFFRLWAGFGIGYSF